MDKRRFNKCALFSEFVSKILRRIIKKAGFSRIHFVNYQNDTLDYYSDKHSNPGNGLSLR